MRATRLNFGRRLAQANMKDACIIRTKVSSVRNTYGYNEARFVDGSEILCTYIDNTTKEEKPHTTEIASCDGVFLLPVTTEISEYDQILLTKRNGKELLPPRTFQVIGMALDKNTIRRVEANSVPTTEP